MVWDFLVESMLISLIVCLLGDSVHVLSFVPAPCI